MKKLSKRFKAGLSLLLVLGMVLSGMVTVRAEGISNRTSDSECKLEKEYINSKDEKYTNNETSGNGEAAEMLSKAAEAEKAAEEAAAAVADLEGKINDLGLEDKTDEAAKATWGAAGSAYYADFAAAGATFTSGSAAYYAGDATDAADKYNNQAKNDQEKVNELSNDVATDASIAFEAVSGCAATAADKAQEAKELLDIALTGDSKDAIVKDLNGEDHTVEEIVDQIRDAAVSASAAQVEAAGILWDEQVELFKAVTQYNIYAAAYDLKLYGQEALWWNTYVDWLGNVNFNTIGFFLTNEQKAYIMGQRNLESKVNFDKNMVNSMNIANIDNLVEAVDNAVEKAEAASAAAVAANEALASAEEIISDASNAIELADGSINYVVEIASKAAAKAAADYQNISESNVELKEKYDRTISELNGTVESNTSTKLGAESGLNDVNGQISVQESKRNSAESIMNNLTDRKWYNPTQWTGSKLEKANKTISEGIGHYIYIDVYVPPYYDFSDWSWKGNYTYSKNTGIWTGNTQEDLDDAQKVVSEYNTAFNKYYEAVGALEGANGLYAQRDNYKSTISVCDKAISDAKKKIDVAVSDWSRENAKEIAALNKMTETQNILKAEQDKADKRVEEASTELISKIKDILSDESTQINQIEYDWDLNAWANEVIGKYENNVKISWKFWETIKDIATVAVDASQTRHWMDDNYQASTIEKIFNHIGLTQWAVSTESREKVMQACIDVYRTAMAEQEKDLATAQAQMAKVLAETTLASEEAIATNVNTLTQTAAFAEMVIDNAKARVDAAKETVDNAQKELEAAKTAVNNANLNKVDLSDLKKSIAEAQMKVNAANEKLDEAKASVKLAEIYKDWAEALIEEHSTMTFINNDGNEEAFDINGDDNVKSQSSSYFTKIQSADENDIVIDYISFRNYIKQILGVDDDAEFESKAINGKGISSSLAVRYWKVQKNDAGEYFFTGESYAENELPNEDAEYFLGYSFKHESDGYHMDGTIVEKKKEEPAPQPSINTIFTTTLDLGDDDTPEGPVEMIKAEDEKIKGNMPAEELELNLEDDDQALGSAVLAQTGTVPVFVYYLAAVALLLAALYFKRAFAKREQN